MLNRPLDRAVRLLADRQEIPPCAPDPEPWFAAQPSIRARAARRCTGCPILQACREAGRDEIWGVWGGIDMTRPMYPTKQPVQEDTMPKTTFDLRPIDHVRAARQIIGTIEGDKAAFDLVMEEAATSPTDTAALICALTDVAARLAEMIAGDKAVEHFRSYVLDVTQAESGEAS